MKRVFLADWSTDRVPTTVIHNTALAKWAFNGRRTCRITLAVQTSYIKTKGVLLQGDETYTATSAGRLTYAMEGCETAGALSKRRSRDERGEQATPK